MAIGIEYVCTGNSGRSPMAEAIAKDYVAQKGLVGRVVITSSGSGMHSFFSESADEYAAMQLDVIGLGLANGIYRGRREEKARRIVGEGVTSDPAEREECFQYLIHAEQTFRDVSLLELGLRAKGPFHKPPLANSDAHLVLAMTEKNAEHIRILGREDRLNGRSSLFLQTLKSYAGLDSDISDPFCQPQEAYNQTRDQLVVAVPRTIERAVEEFRQNAPLSKLTWDLK